MYPWTDRRNLLTQIHSGPRLTSIFCVAWHHFLLHSLFILFFSQCFSYFLLFLFLCFVNCKFDWPSWGIVCTIFEYETAFLFNALNHSYIRKRYSYFVASMSPHPIFTGWQLNTLHEVPSPDISTFHNFHRHVIIVTCLIIELCVCVYFAWSSSNRQSYLAVWVVSTCWSLAGCVYDGLHIAHLPLPSGEHSLLPLKKKRGVLSASVMYWKLSAI